MTLPPIPSFNMNIQFRPVTPFDREKFPIWYERIGGSELFTHFIPSSFVSFEQSKDLLWFIILDGGDEIGAIWFERKEPDETSYDLGIYLNRIALCGKGLGKKIIQTAIDMLIRPRGVQALYLDVRLGNLRAIRCYEGLGFETIHHAEKKTASGIIKFKRMRLLL